jgi:hypothetical protein
VTHDPGRFPATIDKLQLWLARASVRKALIRIGFLDPDTYAGTGATVDREHHVEWLRALADGCDKVLAVTFFALRGAGDENFNRNEKLADFHEDAGDLYAHSLTFQYSSAATALKVRWPAESIAVAARDLREAIEARWNAWSENFDGLTKRQGLKSLTVHVDGQPAE